VKPIVIVVVLNDSKYDTPITAVRDLIPATNDSDEPRLIGVLDADVAPVNCDVTPTPGVSAIAIVNVICVFAGMSAEPITRINSVAPDIYVCPSIVVPPKPDSAVTSGEAAIPVLKFGHTILIALPDDMILSS
jgi:hypothetical protein